MSPESADQRSYIRYRPMAWGGTVVWTDDAGRHDAEVLDESLGGLGVRSPEPIALTQGQVVDLENGEYARKARLVFAREEGPGTRAGFEWTPDSIYVSCETTTSAAEEPEKDS